MPWYPLYQWQKKVNQSTQSDISTLRTQKAVRKSLYFSRGEIFYKHKLHQFASIIAQPLPIIIDHIYLFFPSITEREVKFFNCNYGFVCFPCSSFHCSLCIWRWIYLFRSIISSQTTDSFVMKCHSVLSNTPATINFNNTGIAIHLSHG